jgi:rubrerythrin
MAEPTREEILAMIQQIDADIKDEAEAHKHYKELAEKMQGWGQWDAVPHYTAMSVQEGEHLQRLVKIRMQLLNRYM